MLTAIFQAIKRLTASIERTAEIFEKTNESLAYRFAIVDGETPPRLPAPEGNSRRAGKAVVS